MMTEYIVISLINPILILVLGMVMKFYPPNRINKSIGFRTKSSMADHDSWTYAQKTWANHLLTTGLILLIISGLQVYLVWKFFQEQMWYIVFGVLFLQLLTLLIPYLLTKRKVDTFKVREKEAFYKKINEDSKKP
ncbi:MAG: SdpI family protein [Acholeplasmataceae bacterium]|nr:SdpI family protein [Acholeplasmatales bacterium]